MTDSLKTKLTLSSFRKRFFDLRRKISSNYLCIEFGYDYIQIAEAYYAKNKVNFKKIIRKEIPLEAFDKGVPSDPEAMSDLITNLLIEEKIYINRVAIVLSPDSFFTRLIEIPNNIKDKRIYNYLTNPSSSIQIPIAINNTDFNVYKTCQSSKSKEFNTFFFVASPKIVIENLIKTCEKINLNLLYVEVGFNSLSRLINYQEIFDKDDEDQYLIMLELLPNCTYLTLFDKSSPIMISRLTSIREYPMRIGELGKSSNSEYLSISKLDLKVLVREIKSTLNNFFSTKEKKYNFKIALTGINSLHPDLTKTLSDYIKLPVYQYSPKSNLLLGDINYVSENFYDITFARLFGLGIGLLNNSEIKKKQPLTDFSLVNYYKTDKTTELLKKNIIVDKSISPKKNNLFEKNNQNLSKPNENVYYSVSSKKGNESDETETKNDDINLNQTSNTNQNFLNDNIKKKNKLDMKKSDRSIDSSDKKKYKENKKFKMNTDFLDID